MDILEHQPVYIFVCKQENHRWRPNGSQLLLDLTRMCQRQWLTNGIRCLKVEGLTFLMTNEPPYSPDLAPMLFALFSI